VALKDQKSINQSINIIPRNAVYLVIQFYIKSEEQQPRGMSRYYTLVVNKFTAEPLKKCPRREPPTMGKQLVNFITCG
jgi:hypothetical protein